MWQRWCKMVDECKRAPDCSTRSGSGEWGGGGGGGGGVDSTDIKIR